MSVLKLKIINRLFVEKLLIVKNAHTEKIQFFDQRRVTKKLRTAQIHGS